MQEISGWLRPDEAAKYCHISRRLLADWFARGLKRSKVGGVVLVRREDLDEFLERHRDSTPDQVDALADEVLRNMEA